MRFVSCCALVLALTAGCGQPETACPAIGYVTGIGLSISSPAGITKATLEACWRGHCVTSPVFLQPESTVGATTCAGTGPDSPCGASMVPTGGLHGFADVPGLPAEPVRVTVRFDDGVPHTAEVTPFFSEPNGSACGKAGPQANLVVGPDRQLRPA
jgi:hypothetical protein